MNTHRALIGYAVPPSMEVIAAGGELHCVESLQRWLAKHPVTPYNDDDSKSGGHPMIVEVLPTCRICGCTENYACNVGCVWLEPDLCSTHPEIHSASPIAGDKPGTVEPA